MAKSVSPRTACQGLLCLALLVLLCPDLTSSQALEMSLPLTVSAILHSAWSLYIFFCGLSLCVVLVVLHNDSHDSEGNTGPTCIARVARV